jgi:repressor LexA
MTKQRTFSKDVILEAINHFIVEHGYAPTVEELRLILQVGSKRTVLRYLTWLENEGDIERWPGARGIRLRRSSSQRSETLLVPLVGEAPAGSLMIAEENREGWVQIPTQWATPPSAKHFLLRVKGNSMNRALLHGENIENGDLVIVEQRPVARPGEIIVALVDGQATIKRFAEGPGYWILKPESSEVHSPIFLTDEFQIQGVVKRVLKKGAFLLNERVD